MSRPNYFNNIHKAVRSALFETSLQVARTDFGEAEEAAAAARSVIELMDFLDQHAGHEDHFVFPELASFAPALAATLDAEHVRMEGLQSEIRALAHRAHGPSRKDRQEAGPRLARALSLLVADQLRHMDREETEANAVALAHRTDAEMAQIQGRIQASIPPEKRGQNVTRMMRAVNAAEQAELLSGARATLPLPAFEAVLELTREALGPERWEVLARRLGLDQAAA
jgi:hypothetical protein